MNIGPEQPVDREPLTPEERELAQRLSRLGPSAGPPSTVDARILAAAHDAVVAAHPRVAGRGTRRWPVALGVAASMALAVGIAWRLRPLPEPPPVRAESAAASVETTAAAAAAAPTAAAPSTVIAPAPGPATDADSPALQKALRSAPAATPRDAAKAQPKRESAPPAPAETEAVSDAARAADVAAPPPPPAPPAPQPLSAAAEAASADATATGAAAASDEESKRLSDTIEVSGTVQGTQSVAAPRAASAQAPVAPQREPQSFEDIEIVGVDDSGDEPPAYANSPQVREAWLKRIRELIAESHHQQARDSLDEFQRRYPDQALPDDLQRFQQSKPDPAAP